jgi:hypothetical protein
VGGDSSLAADVTAQGGSIVLGNAADDDVTLTGTFAHVVIGERTRGALPPYDGGVGGLPLGTSVVTDMDALTFTVAGLAQGVPYYVRVAAANSVGYGPARLAAPAAPSTEVEQAAPGSPRPPPTAARPRRPGYAPCPGCTPSGRRRGARRCGSPGTAAPRTRRSRRGADPARPGCSPSRVRRYGKGSTCLPY